MLLNRVIMSPDVKYFSFGCPDLTIYVQYGDTLMLACPSIFLYSRSQDTIQEQNTYETIYGVPEADVEMFNSCNATGREVLSFNP